MYLPSKEDLSETSVQRNIDVYIQLETFISEGLNKDMIHLSQRNREFANITNFTPGSWSFYGKVGGFTFFKCTNE